MAVAFWAYGGSHKTGVRLGLRRILGRGLCGNTPCREVDSISS